MPQTFTGKTGTVSWLTIVVNPSGVVRTKITACGRRAAACGCCVRPDAQ
ncbi:hypothetical protein [Nostoc commune]|nr:hypothetical protein [Nostoc commune]